MTYQLFVGNNLEILPTLPDNSIDSIVTDPPYGLSDNKYVADTIARWIAGERDFVPDGKGFMGKAWDAFVPPPALWDECLRVLKPGGHLLAFFGSRTQDIGALAIRLAGFEIRDSIAWLYGSGFPKSMDISKAIDKQSGYEGEVLGTELVDIGIQGGSMHAGRETKIAEREIKELSPEAQQWQGWGTALKPALEPIVVARKPLGGEIAVRTIIENELNKLGFSEVKWTKAVKPATKSNQKQTFGSTSQPKTAGTFAKTVNAKEMLDTEQTTQKSTGQLTSDLGTTTQAEQTNLLASQSSDLKNKSLKPTDLTASAVENQTEPFLPSTTSTAVEQNTGKEHQAKSGTNLDGLDSPMVIESFAGIATGLSGSLATVLINRLDDGTFEWPANLPEVEKVGTTVANNVLKWGTGGLNIDASRISNLTDKEKNWTPQRQHSENPIQFGGARSGDVVSMYKEGGRWPANIILDPYTAELLDEQSGTLKSGNLSPHHKLNASNNNSMSGANQARNPRQEFGGDTGGASRFFYVAKASKRDRNEGLDELPEVRASAMGYDIGLGEAGEGMFKDRNPQKQNFHPTVKPTALMEYLVKLVTPPGGTVLDPFTGSGSTGKAAILQGFNFIGIEMTQEYVPIIEGRLKHAEAKVAEAKEKIEAQPQGLF